MNLAHLKYAIEVERTQSISQAAENLYMGQPNLSRALKELEAAFNVTIFKRSSKGVVPTEQGREFLQYARSILSKVGDMEEHFARDRKNLQGLSISVPRASYIAHAFSKFAVSLDLELPLDLRFFETNSLNAVKNLEEGECQLAIIRFLTEHSQYFMDYLRDRDIEHRELWTFPHLALMSRSHPLAEAESVACDDLREFIEICHGDLSIPYLSPRETADVRANKRIMIYERGSQFELLERVPGTYMWVSPVPEEITKKYGLVLRKCAGMDNIYKDVLVFRKNHDFTHFENNFLKLVEAERDALSIKVYR